MRFLLIRHQIIDVPSSHMEDRSIDDLLDSLMDDALDDQDSIHETSDTKFEYVPKEIIRLTVEKVEPA